MKVLTVWTRVGGAVLLVFVLGLLTKGVADVGELTGTVNALIPRIDQLQTEMDNRFREMGDEMDDRFREMGDEMDDRFREMDDRFREIDDRFREVDARFVQLENRMEQRFLQIDNRFLRIENILMGRPADADDIGDATKPERAIPKPGSQ